MKKLFTILFLFLSRCSFATTYFVSSSGDDSNPGTSPALAWASIDKVNTTIFLPGDRLLFEGGKTFNGSIFLNSSDANDPNNFFVISSYGTGNAIINAGTSYGFYAYNTQGFSISNLVFDGNSSVSNTDAGIKLLADVSGDKKFKGVSITNIEIKNFGAEGISIYGSNNLTGYQNVSLSMISIHDVKKNGIKIYANITQVQIGWQHSNISVTNCEVYQVPGSGTTALEGNGIVLAGVDGGTIQNCVSHDNGQNNINQNGPVGIWCLESNNITIQYCESYKNHNGTGSDGDGFDFDGGTTNSFMQYNYSHDNDGAGILLGQYANARPWTNNTIRFNISENDAVHYAGAITLFKGPGTTMNGANIYHNTIYTTSQVGNASISLVNFVNWNTGINNVAFYNNIFYSAGGVPLINIPSGYAAFFAGNIYWTSGSSFLINYQGINYSSLANWRITGNEVVGGINKGFNSDPILSNPGLGGTVGYGNSLMSLNAYQIKSSSSPAINAALDLNALYSINVGGFDFWGSALPGGSNNSIGSNQFSGILPIALLNFYGNCSDSGQNLYWSTGEEENVKSIDIMYSGTGIQFNKIAEIIPKGSYSHYSFTNSTESPGRSYYQLKMTDLDGKISYSSVVNILCGKTSDEISVWPNPFNQFIQVSVTSLSKSLATLSLYDASGKLLSQKQVQIQEGNNNIYFRSLDHLPSGAFYLQIIKQGLVEHFKLIRAGN